MTETILWFLITATTHSYTSTTVIATLKSEAACQRMADDIAAKSNAKGGMPNLRAICVSAPASQVVR